MPAGLSDFVGKPMSGLLFIGNPKSSWQKSLYRELKSMAARDTSVNKSVSDIFTGPIRSKSHAIVISNFYVATDIPTLRNLHTQ